MVETLLVAIFTGLTLYFIIASLVWYHQDGKQHWNDEKDYDEWGEDDEWRDDESTP